MTNPTPEDAMTRYKRAARAVTMADLMDAPESEYLAAVAALDAATEALSAT